MNILRVGNFILAKLKRMRARSQMECCKAESPGTWNYATTLGVILLIFVIAFTYAPIAPFVIPWTVIFYAIAYLFGKYLLIYVYSPGYDSGGLFWPVVFNRIIFGMVLGQLILLGVFIFKTHPSLSLVAPLPLITGIFAYVMHALFDRPSTYLSMNEYPRSAENNGESFKHLYKDPVLLLDTHACAKSYLYAPSPNYNLEEGTVPHHPTVGLGPAP